MAKFTCALWMISLHRITGLAEDAFGLLMGALLVYGAFWLPWMFFGSGAWPLGLLSSLIPLAVVRSGVLSLSVMHGQR